MALDTATISFDLADLLGADFDPRRVRMWVTTNVESGIIIDTSAGDEQIRLGSGRVAVAEDGTGSFETWVPSLDSNPVSWQTYVHVDHPDGLTRATRTLGPFTVVGDANLANLAPEPPYPPGSNLPVFNDWSEVESAYPARPAVPRVTWRGWVDPRRIGGSGYTDGDQWLQQTPPVVTRQWFTDFSEHTVASGVPTGWASRWETGGATPSIIDLGGGNKALRVVKGSDAQTYLLGWNTPGTAVTDVELVVKWRSSLDLNAAAKHVWPVAARASDALGVAPWYLGTRPRVTGAVGGPVVVNLTTNRDSGYLPNLSMETPPADVTVTYAASTWYWTRFRVHGDHFAVKYWADGAAEPSSWTVQGYESTVPQAGCLGVTVAYAQTFDVDAFGVGIDGAAAPVSAV